MKRLYIAEFRMRTTRNDYRPALGMWAPDTNRRRLEKRIAAEGMHDNVSYRVTRYVPVRS